MHNDPPISAPARRGLHELRALVLRGGALTAIEFGTRQLLRLASNLVLTRLLFPEAFGLMALVTASMTAFELFSDIGIKASLVHSRRVHEPVFLDTAWTLQAIRGGLLLVVSCLAAKPAALFYGEPELAGLIAATGLCPLIAGFLPTRYTLCTRELRVGPVVAIHVSSQIISLAVMVSAAWAFRSVWTLVLGGILFQLAVLVQSHLRLPGHRNRLAFEADAYRELFAFGKWILFSTALHFLATQGDRFIHGAYMQIEMLGVYAIAVYISESVWRLVQQVSHRVMFPAFSRLVREAPDLLRGAYLDSRWWIDGIVMPGCGVLMAAGGLLIDLLYDARYAGAGWMLEVLAFRTALQCTITGGGMCLLAHGDARCATAQGAVRAVWIFVGMPLAWTHLGVHAAIWTFATANLPAVAIGWYALDRYGLLSLRRELLPIVFVAVGYALGVGAIAIAH